jgi:hypothetical protein
MCPNEINVNALRENANSERGILLSPANNNVRVTIATIGTANSRLSRLGLVTSFESPFNQAYKITPPNAPTSKTVSARLGSPRFKPGRKSGKTGYNKGTVPTK